MVNFVNNGFNNKAQNLRECYAYHKKYFWLNFDWLWSLGVYVLGTVIDDMMFCKSRFDNGFVTNFKILKIDFCGFNTNKLKYIFF